MSTKVTIFTPTYNRSNELLRLYKSLKNQTNHDFEWLVVDDGSTDQTNILVNKMKVGNSGLFPIRYYYQENCGKHAAINLGIDESQSELFFIVDSDDWLPADAIENVIKWENTITNKKEFAGIGGLKFLTNNNLVGTSFEGQFLDCTSLERKRNNITGDKAEVFYTNILKSNKFPIFPGENFLSEYVNWYRIANKGYKIRWINKNIYYCEYLDGGLSSSTGKNTKNFEGFKLTVKELVQYKELAIKEKMVLIGQCGAIGIQKKISLKLISNQINVNLLLLFLLSISALVYVNLLNLVNQFKTKLQKS